MYRCMVRDSCMDYLIMSDDQVTRLSRNLDRIFGKINLMHPIGQNSNSIFSKVVFKKKYEISAKR